MVPKRALNLHLATRLLNVKHATAEYNALATKFQARLSTRGAFCPVRATPSMFLPARANVFFDTSGRNFIPRRETCPGGFFLEVLNAGDFDEEVLAERRNPVFESRVES